jgi:hypothetical protein
MKSVMTYHGRTKRNVIVAVAATLMMLAVSALAQLAPKKPLYTLPGGRHGGIGGYNLVTDSAGNLYGTTWAGGNNSSSCEVYTGVPGCGVVFKLSRGAHGTWEETVLYTFSGGADGAVPANGVILDAAGNLYGTTLFGGDKKPANCQAVSIYPAGCGVVFELSPPQSGGSWTESVLYRFSGGADGSEPFDRLIFDSSGNLYGTTSIGGNNDGCGPPPYGCGVVFELTPSGAAGQWTESVLYTFSGGSDGGFPFTGVTFDTHGNLYGVAESGGDTSVSCNGNTGCGVVFKLTPASSAPWKERVLYAFTGGADGAGPFMYVILDSAGNVYGTTVTGGNTTGSLCTGNRDPGCGVVFELSPPQSGGSWTETVLYTFCSLENCIDGRFSGQPLVFDPAGNLYGVAYNGGHFFAGVVFKLAPTSAGPWTQSILHTFTGGTDGGGPSGNLLLDPAGSLIGVTYFGGNDSECTGNTGGAPGCGVVFEIHQ